MKQDDSKQFLISKCHYYKGEKENPFSEAARTDNVAQNKAMLWFYEQYWVNGNLRSYEKDEPDPTLSEYFSDYIARGMMDFQHDDGVPPSLKALLFNRYMKDSMDGDVEPFKAFYLEYYNKG